MSILWTAARLLSLSDWACCGLFACVIGVQHPDFFALGSPPAFSVTGEGKNKKPVRKNNKKTSVAPRRFLGFELPDSNKMKPSERQRFEIVPSLSQVGVDMTTPIGSFTAKSARISGDLAAAPKTPAAEPTAWLVVRTSSLCTGDRKRNAMLHDALRAKAHPEIRFTLRSLKVRKVDLEARKLTGTASCTMWICGRAQRLQFSVEAHLDQACRLVLKGETKLKLSKMGVVVPRTFGIPLISDEITLWLGVRGRHLGAEPRPGEEVADAR
jgi:polyisoprenoid-binding protein YceI